MFTNPMTFGDQKLGKMLAPTIFSRSYHVLVVTMGRGLNFSKS